MNAHAAQVFAALLVIVVEAFALRRAHHHAAELVCVVASLVAGGFAARAFMIASSITRWNERGRVARASITPISSTHAFGAELRELVPKVGAWLVDIGGGDQSSRCRADTKPTRPQTSADTMRTHRLCLRTRPRTLRTSAGRSKRHDADRWTKIVSSPRTVEG